VGLLIVLNFVMVMTSSQFNPTEEENGLQDVLGVLEYIFTALFIIELAVNMISFWFKLFWMSPWNIFDFVIVFASVLLLFPTLADVPGLAQLTLLRPLRVFRLFKRIPSLKRLLANLAAAMPGVANAFVVLVIVMSIFAIIGVEIFHDSTNAECSAIFTDFATAMFALFIVTTGDSWSGSTARPCIEGSGGASYPFFVLYSCSQPLDIDRDRSARTCIQVVCVDLSSAMLDCVT
jgi:hypothetical protein